MAEDTGDDVPSASTSSTEPDALEKKIIRQIEFYFGDRNLSRDKFLQNKIKENEDGWVELSVLLTFSRLKALSTDCSLIAAAIRKSTSGLLEVSEDGLKVKRKSTDPVPTLSLLSPEDRKDMSNRTLYMKGFPKDSTLDDIQDFLLQFGETEMIRMKKDLEKQFKGSIFVEYKSVDSISKVIEKKAELKYKDEPLTVETKQDYFKRKDAERKEKKTQSHVESSSSSATEKSKDTNGTAFIRKEGAILHFTGCGDGTTRETLKEYFRQFATVAWVDFQKGDTEGYIRFDEDGGAKTAYDGAMANVPTGEVCKICDSDVTLKILEGEEESAYWEKMKDDQANRKATKGGGRGGGRGGRRGRGGGRGRGGWKGGRRGRKKSFGEEEEPPSKSAKLEEDGGPNPSEIAPATTES